MPQLSLVPHYGEIAGEKDAPVPLPGSPEAEALLNGPPTMADRQWAARQAGWSQPSDRLHGGLIQIGEPRPR